MSNEITENELSEYEKFANADLNRFFASGGAWRHNAFGFDLVIAPGVYPAHPFYSYSTSIVLDHLPSNLEGKNLLDVGCGSGVIGIAAAYKQAKMIMLLDVSSPAVTLAQANIAIQPRQISEKCRVYRSDVFSGLDESCIGKFDIITGNLWFPSKSQEYKEMHDAALIAAEKFVSQSLKYLNDDGCVYLTSSQDSDVDAIEAIFTSQNVTPHITSETHKVAYDRKIKVDYLLYSWNKKGQPHPV